VLNGVFGQEGRDESGPSHLRHGAVLPYAIPAFAPGKLGAFSWWLPSLL